MAEIQGLHDALLLRMDEIIGYLNQLPLDQMPEDAQRLLYLILSLAEVAPAVEFYKQPEVVDGFLPHRFVPMELSNISHASDD